MPSTLPVGRLLVLGAVILVVGVVVAAVLLFRTHRSAPLGVDDPGPPPLTWTGPAPTTISGKLSDGTAYQPRHFLTPSDSVGLALTADGAAWRVLARVGDKVNELRRVPVADAAQFDGFTASGDTVVWAESTARAGAEVRTTLYRANWRTGAKATIVTSGTGEVSFYGSAYDLVVRDNKVFWAAAAGGTTEIRSVALTGGTVTVAKLTGPFALTTPPWAVTASPARGRPVELVNLTTNQRITVPTAGGETATCGPVWCRVTVLESDSLVRIDLQHPDGTARRRVAGSEATPAIDQVALLDRFVPLKTDLRTGAGLSIYDIKAGRTSLVAVDVSNVQGAGGLLWWSTGAASAGTSSNGAPDKVTWHAVDLSGA